jgi:cobalt-zinc-cadmium efflux system outer membrane protein
MGIREMKLQNATRCGWRLVCAVLTIALMVIQSSGPATAQTVKAVTSESLLALDARAGLAPYVDQSGGMTADEAVAYALEHNGELTAARKELDAARALVKQARLRANPMLDVGGSKQLNGGDDSVMVSGSLPLELGGRRSTRILVAEREVEMREAAFADRERMLAAEVRAKFGEALAQVYKLGFTEDLLKTGERGYRLVAARVVEGNSAPLEQNQMLVEVNRMRSMREAGEGKVQVAMFELRNVIGMSPDEPLRLRGDFTGLVDNLPPVEETTRLALSSRPDLLAARAAESLAAAQIEQARAKGRPDASLSVGYQRMSSGFPVNGINDRGQLAPVMGTFHTVTAGVSISLPVRNKNQGTIEAAVAQSDAAKSRREFAELTVRREVASAYARYTSAARAMEIYRVGVQGQAETNLKVVQKTYELGARTLLDYIAEQRRFIDVENSFIDAVLDTYQARVEIARAAGSPELIKK